MIRRAVLSLMSVLAALVLVAGCGGSSNVDCGLDGCTVTFPRSGDVAVSVLGAEARLVGVQDGMARLEVAGTQVTLAAGGEAQAGPFVVGVDRITDTEVVVRVRA